MSNDTPRPGRPVQYPGLKQTHVQLTHEHIEIARKLGDGNVSAGIRKALEQAN